MILLNSKTLEELGLKTVDTSSNPILPDTREKTLEITGRAGIWDFGAELKAREFKISLAFSYAQTKEELYKKIRDFATFLVDAKGNPKNLELRFLSEPEKYYIVRYTGGIEIDRILNFGFFTLRLIAFDPYAYSEKDAYNSDSSYRYDAGLTYPSPVIDNPTSFIWTNPIHTSGIYNYSPLNTPLIIEINGTVSSPSIKNATTGENLFLPSITNSLLEVDGQKMTVKKYQINLLKDCRGKFITLVSGLNELYFEGLNPNATVTYKWKHKFL